MLGPSSATRDHATSTRRRRRAADLLAVAERCAELQYELRILLCRPRQVRRCVAADGFRRRRRQRRSPHRPIGAGRRSRARIHRWRAVDQQEAGPLDTAYAAEAARRAGRRIRFSMTTNATLMSRKTHAFSRTMASTSPSASMATTSPTIRSGICMMEAVHTSTCSRVSRCAAKRSARPPLGAGDGDAGNGRTAAHPRSSHRAGFDSVGSLRY